jgi:hypothetical protein
VAAASCDACCILHQYHVIHDTTSREQMIKSGYATLECACLVHGAQR